jgi:hypothetical protein
MYANEHAGILLIAVARHLFTQHANLSRVAVQFYVQLYGILTNTPETQIRMNAWGRALTSIILASVLPRAQTAPFPLPACAQCAYNMCTCMHNPAFPFLASHQNVPWSCHYSHPNVLWYLGLLT